MAMLGTLGSSLNCLNSKFNIHQLCLIKDVPREQHPSIANLFNVKLGEQQMNESKSL